MAERFEDKLRARRGLDDGSINHGDVLISEAERDALADAVEALRSILEYPAGPEDVVKALALQQRGTQALARLDGAA